MSKNKQYDSKWDKCKNFDEVLALSHVKEKELAMYLIKYCGFLNVIPVGNTHKTYSVNEVEEIKLPDLLGFYNGGRPIYIEAKHKNRRIKYRDNGVNLDLIQHYLKAQKHLGAEVYILFKDDLKELNENKDGIKIDTFIDKDGNELWYGNSLNLLLKKFRFGTGANNQIVVYFPLSAMLPIDKLPFGKQTTLPEIIIKEILGKGDSL